MKNKFEIRSRYSDTNNCDKHGRWSRLIYSKGVLIAWINRHNGDKENEFIYLVVDFFPTMASDNPCFSEVIRNYDKAIARIDKRFYKFIKSQI